MKTFLTAVALTFAVPAFAQTPPAATDPHAHQKGMNHAKHEQGKHDCKECCEKMKAKDGKMECMDKKAAASAETGAPQGHSGH